MNQKQKYIGLLAILPLFVVGIAPDFIGDADALKAQGSPGSQAPKSYGSATADRVCGDQLCNEPKSEIVPIRMVLSVEEVGNSPIIEIVDTNKYSGESQNTFNAIVKVKAGDVNIENVRILIDSDQSSVWTMIGGIFAHDTAINTVRIQAQDPTSITASIVDYQLND